MWTSVLKEGEVKSGTLIYVGWRPSCVMMMTNDDDNLHSLTALNAHVLMDTWVDWFLNDILV